MSSADLTSNGNITVTNDAGGGNTLSLTAAVTGTGTITITETQALKIDSTGASGLSAGGAVILTAAGITQVKPISAPSVDINSTANVELETSGNAIGSLTATVTGTIKVANNAALTIAGITATGLIELNASGTVTQGSAASDTIQASGPGAGLLLLGAGSYTLDNSNNDIKVLAANASGNITVNSIAFAVDTLNAIAGIPGGAGAVDLSAVGTDSITLNTGISRTGGNITLNSPVILGANVTISTQGSGAIAIEKAVTGPGNALTLDAGAGAITIGGDIGATGAAGLGAVQINTTGTGPAAVTLKGNIYTAGAPIAITGPVTLDLIATSGSFTLDTVGSSGTGASIDIKGVSVSASTDYDLTLTAGTGKVTVDGSIGGSSDRLGAVVISSTSAAADAVKLQGDIYTANENITITGAVTLAPSGAGITLDTDSGGGSITLAVVSGGGKALTLTAGTGDVAVNGAVGASGTELGTITVTNGAAVSFSGAVFTSGSMTVNHSGLFTTGGNISADAGFTAAGTAIPAAVSNIGGDITTANNVISFNKGLTISHATGITLASGGGAVTLGAVSGTGKTLDINAGTGPITISGSLGGAGNSLAAVTIDNNGALFLANNVYAASVSRTNTANPGGGTTQVEGNITAAGNISFSGALTVNSQTKLEAGANISVTGAVNANPRIDFVAAGTVNLGGAVTITGAAVGMPPLSLLIEADGLVPAAITASGDILLKVDGNLSLTSVSTSGALQVSTRTASRDIVYGASNLNLGDPLGDGTSMATAIADHAYYNSTFGITAITANPFSIGDINHTGRIYITDVSPVYPLVLINSSDIFFNGNYTVSGSGRDLTVESTGTVILAGTPRAINLGSERLVINGAVSLRGSTNTADTLTTMTANGGIAIAGTINGRGAGHNSLTLNASSGAVALSGVLGGSVPLGEVQVNTTGNLTLSDDIHTDNADITITGPVLLDTTVTGKTDITLNSGSGSGNINLISVNGTVNGTGTSLTLSPGSGTVNLKGGISTGNAGVTVNGTAALDASASVIAINSGNGNISVEAVSGTVTALTLNAGTSTGTVTLKGNIATGNAAISIPSKAVLAPGPYIILDSGNGAIDLAAVDGSTANTQSLTITAGTGNVSFGGAVGAGNSLNTLEVTTTGGITFHDNVTIGSGTLTAPAYSSLGYPIAAALNGNVEFVKAPAGTISFKAGQGIYINGNTVLTAPTTTVTIETTAGSNGYIEFTGGVGAVGDPTKGNADLEIIANGTGHVKFSNNNNVTVGINASRSTDGALRINAAALDLVGTVALKTNSNGHIRLRVDGLTMGTSTIDAGAGDFQLAPLNPDATIEYGPTDTALVTDVYYSSAWANIQANSFIIGSDSHRGNIYLKEAGVVGLELTVKQDTSNSGEIHFITSYGIIGTPIAKPINLEPGSGGVIFDGAVEINLGAADFTVGGALILAGTGPSTITATTGISLESVSRGSGADANNLTLAAGSSDIVINGAMGSNTTAGRLGAVTITGAVVSLQEIYSGGAVTVNNSGLLTLNGMIKADGGFVQSGSGAATLKGDISTVTNSITFVNSITLDPAGVGITLDTGTGGGDITLGAVTGTGKALTLNAGIGDVSVSGAVGGASGMGLGTITVTNGAAVRFTNAVFTSGSMTVNHSGLFTSGGDISADAGFTAAGDTASAAAVSNIGGNITTNNSVISFNKGLTISHATGITLTSGGGDVALGSVSGTGKDLTLTAGTGKVTVGGSIGGSSDPLREIAISSTSTDADAVKLQGDIYTANNNIAITGAVTLAPSGTGIILNSGATTGNIIFNNRVTGAKNLIGNSGTGSITFKDNVDIGSADLTGNVNFETASSSNTIITFEADTDIKFNSNVILNHGTNLTGVVITTNGGNLEFTGTVSGNVDFTAKAAGNVTFNGSVDTGLAPSPSPAAALVVDAAGMVLGTGPINLVAHNDGNIHFTVDSNTLGSGSYSYNAGAGDIQLAPHNPSKKIEYGPSNTGIADVWYDSGASTVIITAGSFTVGSLTQYGDIYINGVANTVNELTARNDGESSPSVKPGKITFIGGYITSNKPVHLYPGDGGIVFQDTVNIDLGTAAFGINGGLMLDGSASGTAASITAGGIQISGAITGKTANMNSLTLTSSTGDIILGSTGSTVGTDATPLGTLGINAGSNTFQTNPGAHIYVYNAFVPSAGTINIGGNITVTTPTPPPSGITFTTDITLLGDVTLNTSAGNGPVSIGAVNGTATFAVNAGTGTVTLNGDIDTGGISITGMTALNPLGAVISLNSNAGSISLEAVSGTGIGLTLTAGTEVTLNGSTDPGGKLTINGNTVNKGTIAAAPLYYIYSGDPDPTSTILDYAVEFKGNYTEESGGFLDGIGDGGTSGKVFVAFHGNAAFVTPRDTGATPPGWLVFLGDDKTISAAPGGRVIPNVLVYLNSGKKLTMASGKILQRGDNFIVRQGDINLGNGIWHMISAISPDPATANGFEGYSVTGVLRLAAGVGFAAKDFYLKNGFTFDPLGTPNTLTITGDIDLMDIPSTNTALITAFSNTNLVCAPGSPAGISELRIPVYSSPVFQISSLKVDAGAIAKLGSHLDIKNDVEINGTLNAGTSNPGFNITLGGDWIQTGAFGPLEGTVTFTALKAGASNIAKIDARKTTFYNFACTTPGATIKFATYPFPAYTPSDPDNDYGHHITGNLTIKPSSGNITLTRIDTVGDPPSPEPAADILNAGYADKFWNFYYQPLDPLAVIEMDHVEISYSWARVPIPIPAGHWGSGTDSIDTKIVDWANYFNVGWMGLYLIYSFTEDSDHNGRIDRIRVQAYSRLWTGDITYPHPNDTFTAEVEGYTVKGYSRPAAYNPAPTNYNDADFTIYIDLVEKDYPDTSAIPRWRMLSNTNLLDKATQEKHFTTLNRDWMTTTDTVPPVINYALALPRQTPAGSGGGVNEIFFRMSEAVNVISGVTKIMAHADDYAADFPVEAIGEAGGGIVEFKAKAGTPFEISSLANGGKKFNLLPEGSASPGEVVQDLAVEAEYPPRSDRNLGRMAFPLPLYPAIYGDYTSYATKAGGGKIPANHNMPLSTAHRITDLLISVPLQGSEVQPFAASPILARDTSVDMNPDYPSSIREFDGTRRLRNTDLNFQVMMNKDIAAPGLGLEMIYTAEKNVGEEYKSRSEDNGIEGLWLPGPRNSTAYIVPQPYPQVYTAPGDPDTNNRFIFRIPQGNLTSEATMEFYFRFRGGSPGIPEDMIVTRLGVKNNEAIPDKWWQLIKPFSFKVQDITRQRSGVTILNNVINPNQGEQVFVDYILTRGGRVTIQVFTLDGNLVKALERSGKDAGEYIASWDGKNNGGRVVARGMYFIRVVAPDIDEIRKVMVVK
ncbi:hypothetical protein AGMMS49546_03910 [Spirochaetia bacterium]|nr:hypothetical protein AGMMS49546_03910 [Spirochaetia bacterium]